MNQLCINFLIFPCFRVDQQKLEKRIQEITSEKDLYFKQVKEFELELVDVKSQYAQLQANYERTVVENAESNRNLKVLKVWLSDL